MQSRRDVGSAKAERAATKAAKATGETDAKDAVVVEGVAEV